jgi:hypothetical protein
MNSFPAVVRLQVPEAILYIDISFFDVSSLKELSYFESKTLVFANHPLICGIVVWPQTINSTINMATPVSQSFSNNPIKYQADQHQCPVYNQD